MIKKKFDLFFVLVFLVVDFLAIFLSFYLAWKIRIDWGFMPIESIIPYDQFLKLAAAFSAFWLFLLAINGLYSFKKKPVSDEFLKIGFALAAGLMVVFAYFSFTRMFFFSRGILLIAWFLSCWLVFITHLLLRHIKKIFFLRNIGIKTIVLLGSATAIKELKRVFQKPASEYRVVGWSKNPKFYLDLIKNKKPDLVIMSDSSLSNPRTKEVLDYCEENGLGFQFIPDLVGLRLASVEIETISKIPIIQPKKTPLDGWGRIVKRIFDLTASFILLIILSPLLIITTFLIKVASKGPVFFIQKRWGRGKTFKMYKFRTMKIDAPQDHKKMMKKFGVGFKLKKDPRLTPLGTFLRKLSIDELPQLINVLKGEMSLVGPRPPMPEEIQQTPNFRLWMKKIHLVKPGLTGLWQVGGRADLGWDNRLKLDLVYIENWSFLLDLAILFKTIMVVFREKGAY